MTGLLDQELLDVEWKDLEVRTTALALHCERLRHHPVALLWQDELEAALYEQHVRRDVLAAISGVLDYLRGNGRLLTPTSPPTLPTVSPPLGNSLPAGLRTVWLGLLGGALADSNLVSLGVGLFTWHRPNLVGIRTVNVATAGGETMPVPALREAADWETFLFTHQRPDLSGKRVAVLGGKRAPIERARQSLASYGLTDFRWLPPSREENRTQADTLSRLQTVHLLVVCTDLLGHTDTDHLKGGWLHCERCDVHNHSTSSIVELVLKHFRGAH